MRKWKVFVLALLLVPLVVGAETISWTPATTFTDGSAIPSSVMSTLTFYLRIWNVNNPAGKVYFGETVGGGTSWTDNVLLRANSRMVIKLVPGDNVMVTVSQSYKDSVGVERDSAESAPYRYSIPKVVVPPPPPVVSPSCNPPTGITITK